MRLVWEDDAWEDYLYWQTQDRKILKRVNLLIKDIRRSPFDGIGKPEPLKHNLSGWWSRRIDDTDRIVYYERDGIIYIVSCSPKTASVDFGLIAPNGRFYHMAGKDGSINQTINLDMRGEYYLAIRNNSSNTVSVYGFVNY